MHACEYRYRHRLSLSGLWREHTTQKGRQMNESLLFTLHFSKKAADFTSFLYIFSSLQECVGGANLSWVAWAWGMVIFQSHH